MKRLKVFALVVALLMAFSSFTGCFYEPERNFTPTYPDYGNYPINNPHFSERQIVEPDKEAIAECMSLVITLAEDPSAFDDMVDEREDFYGYYYQVIDSFQLSRLAYYLDTTNEEAGDLQDELYAYAIELENDTFAMEKAVFGGVHGEKMTEIYGQDYYEMVMNYQDKDDETLDIQERINELETEYNNTKPTDANASKLADLYIELITLKNQLAAKHVDEDGNRIYNNYLEMAYANTYGRDYTPDGVVAFRSAIVEHVGDFRDLMYDNVKSGYTADKVISADEIKSYMPKIINRTIPEMINSWNYMMERGLYNFDASAKKANTSFVTSFSAYGDAFMFLGARNSLVSDLSTTIHEFGHYNAEFAVDPEKEGEAASSYDLLETHSQALELITLETVEKLLDSYYTKTYRESYVFNLMLNMAWSMLFNCGIDEFEYAVAKTAENNPENLTEDYLNNQFSKIMNKYWPQGVSYAFYEIPHLFTSPGYCISYSTSLVFSGVVWSAENNIEKYLEVVSYGANHPLGYVVEQTGLANPLDAETIEMVVENLSNHCIEYFGW